MTIEERYPELRQEIRELALTMVRLEQLAKDANRHKRWWREVEIDKARDAVRERRSALLHEVWLWRREF